MLRYNFASSVRKKIIIKKKIVESLELPSTESFSNLANFSQL